MSERTFLTQEPIEYELGTGIGCWAKSNENLPKGTTRIIKGVLMHVWARYRRGWFGCEVWWVPVDREYGHDYGNLREWRGRSE